ncbi:tetratricopeptide repeat protein [Thalassococcus sp. S3]|uniref:tetratricopeptide repeat protein n=1 Tax=Thalassococcus sp. S3 TaxID=2017482 RepID=UPI001024314B|nr:SEL1-like repeat protein [Thalassococcus sp. S3]QBF30870.1 hypothetical protein CFI11_06525 [Thalassococcus sp. S3]
MKRLTASVLTAGLLAAAIPAAPVQARTLELAFMPPQIQPQHVCGPASRESKEDDLEIEGGDAELNDRVRARYLRRDIQRLQARSPDASFDFIQTLISRLAIVDPDFAGSDELIARIQLYVDAGRFDALHQAGLVGQLRQMADAMTNNDKLQLSQFYLNGIGVDPDPDFALGLIRDAAFDGNANALLSLARMELQGTPVPGWDAPLDLTVTMAFGGILGQLNRTVCKRAERIAQEYLNGEIVSPNPGISYAWYKFAADMGSANAAWRVVEFHLAADAVEKDNRIMIEYLRLAVERGITLDQGQFDQIKSSGAATEEELLDILGYNHSNDDGRNRPSIAPYLQMAVNIDGERADDDSFYMDYLRELTQLDTAPGWVFTRLAKETLVRRGRWAGEPEAMALFEEATLRGDPEGQQLLGLKLVRWRDDPVKLNRAIDLLTDTVTRYGMMASMDHLDGIYRCKAPDAPLLREADLWAENYRASEHETVGVSATDLIALDPFKEPLTIAQIQTQALGGRIQSLAHYVQRVQVSDWASARADRLWAARLDRSDQALEAFAELEFELATNPAERRLAIELFRRVYLNNGVTTALDLAIALVEDNAKKPEIAEEILDLLTRAGNRGEGAAIRLKSRLLADTVPAYEVFQEYEDEIEARGDFLALMFAIPFVSAEKAADYFDRAVSLMACGTKDVEELGDAHAIRMDPRMSFHWRQVGLAIEGGHVLSKLRLSDRQMEAFNEGAAPTELEVYQRLLAEGKTSAHRSLFRLTANPDLETYDPDAAAQHMLALLGQGAAGDRSWVLSTFRRADEDVRALISEQFDMTDLYLKASQSGDVAAKFEFGLLLRDTARAPSDLANSARWLREAAEAGNADAMAEFGYALAYGIGVQKNVKEAIQWLEHAATTGNRRAEDLVSLLRLSVVR